MDKHMVRGSVSQAKFLLSIVNLEFSFSKKEQVSVIYFCVSCTTAFYTINQIFI